MSLYPIWMLLYVFRCGRVKLHEQLGATMIYVTHDQVEAMTLADKIVVLRDGQIEQVGTPRELYEHPKPCSFQNLSAAPK